MDKLLQRHPDLADALASMLDPAVRRAMQSVSFRKARSAWQRDRSEDALLGAPHHYPARALPSCSVVQVEGAGSRLGATLPRGTELVTKAQPVCRFRTVYDVAIAPLAIAPARFVPCIDVPPALGVPPESACAIAIAIESTDPALALDEAVTGPVRLFIDADPATRAALHDALFAQALCTCVQSGRQWCQLATPPFAPVGCADDDALLPALSGERQGLRLLAEYFAFPEKFDFFDIDLMPALARCPAGTRRLVLHVILPELATASLLQSLAPAMLRLGCTPVVNLFSRAAEPLRMTAGRNTYPLRPFPVVTEVDATLYSVDAVSLLHVAEGDSTAVELPRFEALRRVQADRYWLTRHAGTAGGVEDTISFVDGELRPLEPRAGTVSVQLTCTNGAAPASLPIGRPDGDLAGTGPASRYPVRFLRRPSTSRFPAVPDGRPERLLASLAPAERGFTQASLPALLDLLRLYAFADSGAVERQISGIVGLDHCAAKAWLRFPQGAAYMHGIEVRMTVNAAMFDRCSVFAFAQVMERLFACYAGEGSFTQLVVLTLDGQELVRCGARAGGAVPV